MLLQEEYFETTILNQIGPISNRDPRTVKHYTWDLTFDLFSYNSKTVGKTVQTMFFLIPMIMVMRGIYQYWFYRYDKLLKLDPHVQMAILILCKSSLFP